MKQRNLIIGLLVMLAVAVSGFTFAFWSAGVTGDSDVAVGTIEIGQGDAVTTTVTVADVADAGLLVHTGYQDDTTTFDDLTLTFSVAWDEDDTGAAGTTGTLNVTVDSYDIVDDLGTTTGLTTAQIDAMFTIVVTSGDQETMTLNGTQNVVVTVTFTDEPATKAIYDKVANGTLKINLTFLLDDIVTPS